MVYCYTDNEIRSVLKELRIKKKVTQQEVADKLDVTKGYISQVELGVRPIPRYRMIIEWIDIFGIKPKYFEELLSNKELS